jgi:protein-S-isoprenylcysteine O-methyltransferase Ste14
MIRILPPLLFLIFVIGMGIACWMFGFKHYLLYPWNLIGLPFLIIGITIAQMSKNVFKKEDTNIDTFKKPNKMITGGFYKFSRNPMYLGFVIALLGVALLYQASLLSLFLLIVFSIILDKWYISFEEKMMHQEFGKEYEAYKNLTRRWI